MDFLSTDFAIVPHPCFSLIPVLSASVASANASFFKSIQCLDVNAQAKAPVYLDIEVVVPNNPSGTRLELGNIIPISGQKPVQTTKDFTVSGVISSVTSDGTHLNLAGTFGTILSIELKTGASLLNGLVKYAPNTGELISPTRLTNYPIRCLIQH